MSLFQASRCQKRKTLRNENVIDLTHEPDDDDEDEDVLLTRKALGTTTRRTHVNDDDDEQLVTRSSLDDVDDVIIVKESPLPSTRSIEAYARGRRRRRNTSTDTTTTTTTWNDADLKLLDVKFMTATTPPKNDMKNNEAAIRNRPVALNVLTEDPIALNGSLFFTTPLLPTPGHTTDRREAASDGPLGSGYRAAMLDSTCAICQESLSRDPAAIPCGHVFCHSCLEQSFQTIGPKCPVCRKKTTRTRILRLFI